MSDQTYVEYECTHQTFRPVARYPVRWLEWEADYPLVQMFWPEQTPEGWREARQEGFQYCALIEHGQIQAMAAVWRYSEAAWEVASVYTRPEVRGGIDTVTPRVLIAAVRMRRIRIRAPARSSAR